MNPSRRPYGRRWARRHSKLWLLRPLPSPVNHPDGRLVRSLLRLSSPLQGSRCSWLVPGAFQARLGPVLDVSDIIAGAWLASNRDAWPNGHGEPPTVHRPLRIHLALDGSRCVCSPSALVHALRWRYPRGGYCCRRLATEWTTKHTATCSPPLPPLGYLLLHFTPGRWAILGDTTTTNMTKMTDTVGCTSDTLPWSLSALRHRYGSSASCMFLLRLPSERAVLNTMDDCPRGLGARYPHLREWLRRCR